MCETNATFQTSHLLSKINTYIFWSIMIQSSEVSSYFHICLCENCRLVRTYQEAELNFYIDFRQIDQLPNSSKVLE